MRTYLPYLRIGGIILVGLVLLFLPSTFFDEGESLCLSVRLFATECPGCGMTRALMHLLHLDFAEAAYFNQLSFVVAPLLAFLVARILVTDAREIVAGPSGLYK